MSSRPGRVGPGMLESKHKAREMTLAACRKTIQACAASIRAVHREELDNAEELAAQAAAPPGRGQAAGRAHPDIRHAGFVHDASRSTPRPA